MKMLIITLAATVLLILGGWSFTDRPAIEPIEAFQEPIGASSIEQVAGRWFAFPAGLLIQINPDGSAQFGLDRDGTVLGHQAQMWFEGPELSVRYTDYEGQDAACAKQTGHYTVDTYESGNITFIPVEDDCRSRMESLSGAAETGFRVNYHPVQD